MKLMSIGGVLALTLAVSLGSAGTTSAATDSAEESQAGVNLADVIAHPRRDEKRARDEWRHPMETLTFEAFLKIRD